MGGGRGRETLTSTKTSAVDGSGKRSTKAKGNVPKSNLLILLSCLFFIVVSPVGPTLTVLLCFMILLFVRNFLELADLFLNLPLQIFDFAFGLQIAVIDNLPDDLLDLAFHDVHLAFRIVLSA